MGSKRMKDCFCMLEWMLKLLLNSCQDISDIMTPEIPSHPAAPTNLEALVASPCRLAIYPKATLLL
jgi:hypothetical protein